MSTEDYRRFGHIRKVTKRGHTYLEASYPTPDEARYANPNLPKRITKTVRPEYEPVLHAWLSTAEKQIMLGAWEDPTKKRAENKASTTTFGQYARKYHATHTKADGSNLAPTTLERNMSWLENYLFPTFGNMPMNAISTRMVQDWWDTWPLGANGEGKTQRWSVYSYFKTIMKHAATTPIDDQGHTLIPANPCMVKAKKPRVEHESLIAEYDELDLLASFMPNRLALAIYMGGVVGLREGEILALTRSDIDLENHRITVNKSVKQLKKRGSARELIIGPPKTENSYRKPSYPDWLHERIVAHLDAYVTDESDALIFTSERRGMLIAPQTFRNLWYKALRHAPRLQGMHFHDLRHTALTHWGEAGASVAQLMEIAGHSEIKTVTRYQQISITQRKQSAKNLEEQYKNAQNTTNKQESTSASNGNSDPLVSVLAGLPVESQVEVLRAVDEQRQAVIISQLPTDVQVKLLPLLL